MSEPLENEIEEELRRKQLKALWDKFGLYLIGAVLVIILSFGGYEFSKYLGYKNSETSSDQYESALEALVNENNNQAIEIFESLLNESNGYSGLSLFNLANIAIKEGKNNQAVNFAQLRKVLCMDARSMEDASALGVKEGDLNTYNDSKFGSKVA